MNEEKVAEKKENEDLKKGAKEWKFEHLGSKLLVWQSLVSVGYLKLIQSYVITFSSRIAWWWKPAYTVHKDYKSQ